MSSLFSFFLFLVAPWFPCRFLGFSFLFCCVRCSVFGSEVGFSCQCRLVSVRFFSFVPCFSLRYPCVFLAVSRAGLVRVWFSLFLSLFFPVCVLFWLSCSPCSFLLRFGLRSCSFPVLFLLVLCSCCATFGVGVRQSPFGRSFSVVSVPFPFRSCCSRWLLLASAGFFPVSCGLPLVGAVAVGRLVLGLVVRGSPWCPLPPPLCRLQICSLWLRKDKSGWWGCLLVLRIDYEKIKMQTSLASSLEGGVLI